MYSCICTRISVYICVYTYMYIYIFICICICLCMGKCITHLCMSCRQKWLKWITALYVHLYVCLYVYTKERDSKNSINSGNFDLVAVCEPQVQPTNVACSTTTEQSNNTSNVLAETNGMSSNDDEVGDQTNATTVIGIARLPLIERT